MMTAKALAACVMLASQTYGVPPAVMVGIMHVEGGKIGQEVRNTNGSYDLGPMQVNTLWLPDLSKHWRIPVATARRVVRDDGCMNVKVAAWILHQKIADAGSLYKGIAWYHSASPYKGYQYAAKVINVLEKKGFIKHAGRTQTPPHNAYASR